ncbi:MAG: hypothetical protein CML06_16905 [Pseudomonadales bacterium]|nr:hypothetical protein [Pseudomonadales bacterium]
MWRTLPQLAEGCKPLPGGLVAMLTYFVGVCVNAVKKCLIGLVMVCLPALVQAQVGLPTSGEQAPAQVDAVSKELELLQRELKQQEQRGAELRQQIEGVKQEIQAAPELAQQMRTEIRQLEQADSGADPDLPAAADALEGAINLLDAQTKALQTSLSYVMDRIGEQQALPSQAREQVAAAQKEIKRLQERQAELQNSQRNAALKNVQLELVRQQLDNANLRRDLAQIRLEGYQKLLDLYTLNRDLLFLRLGMLKSTLALLREQREQQRLDNAGQHQDGAVALSGRYTEVPPVLETARDENQRLREMLVQLSRQLNTANDQLAEGKQNLQDIRYRFEVARQQLELTQYYQSVDDQLLRQRQALQAAIREQESDSDLETALSQARLAQFKLDGQLHQVRTDTSRQNLVNNALQQASAQSAMVAEDLNRLLQARADVLGKLVEVNAEYVVALTNLELLRQDQLSAREKFYQLLNEQLFWRRSATPLDWEWLTLLPGSVHWFVFEHPWLEPLQIWYQVYLRKVYPVVVLVLLGTLYWGGRRRILLRFTRAREQVGKVTRDRFRYTLEALLGTVLLALPAPILMLILGAPLVQSGDASLFTAGVGSALLVLARWVFLFEFIRALIMRNGLARGHFRWRKSAVAALSRWLPLLYLQLPAAFVFIVVWQEGDETHAGILGRAAFLLVTAIFMLFCLRMFHPRTGITQQPEKGEAHWYQRWNRTLFWISLLIPAALLLLSSQGYSFTAMETMVLLTQTIMYGFFVFVLQQVLVRWFAVMERKLAYSRALARRDAQRKAKEKQAAAESSGDAVPELEIPALDVATVSEQNRALLRTLGFTLFAVICYLSWQDFFQAIQVFQEVELWQYNVATDTGTEIRTVTLKTLLVMVLAVLLTYAGLKNLPGLIEVLILQRLNVDFGIRFAITTTARYLVIVAGVLVVSGLIGLEWSKLGWLVAALGVGLGFGLQEIFANFISGLIILFERPIRIGDTVTINDLSGTVAQIRMRATTITDWDQKEIIIPNKTFVTNQFINWTLSDSTTRVVIKVGVAYGSDTTRVTELLLEAARANGDVLKDPPPTAFFLAFGSSSLDFELRVFVAEFGRRLALIHSLHMEIDRRFREAGIEIAFPQLDLHVRNLPKDTK